MTTSHESPRKPWNGRLLDALLHVLDRQIHDHRGNPLGVVDDINLDGVRLGEDIAEGTPAPLAVGLVTSHVLMTRILGGRPPESRLQYIDWTEIDRLDVVMTLRPSTEEPDTLWGERWLRRWVIGRIPGGRHAPE